MPESKKRKKDGKTVGNGRRTREKRVERFGDMESGVSLQDLINVYAYQEAHPEPEIDFSDPDTQAVIKAVDSIDIDNKEQD